MCLLVGGNALLNSIVDVSAPAHLVYLVQLEILVRCLMMLDRQSQNQNPSLMELVVIDVAGSGQDCGVIVVAVKINELGWMIVRLQVGCCVYLFASIWCRVRS